VRNLALTAPFRFRIGGITARDQMSIRVTTRHSEGFDICAGTIDASKSPYARTVGDYTAKVKAFYRQLGVPTAIWAVPEVERPKYLEPRKTVEYVLEVDESRVVAYVDEEEWSAYLYGKRGDFAFSEAPAPYRMTSILIRAPVARAEVKARRRYRCTNGPDRYELVDEVLFDARAPYGVQK
jgi:hypothetical protein